MSTPRVYLVGAGPGDPGLVTVRGHEVLATADVVVYDALIPERLLDEAPAEAERIYVGKRASRHTLAQDEINALLVEKARAGATVVRLKGGDPFVFGRGGEEALALAEAGIDFEVVPGVTAAVAAPAYAGIPVTHRHLASGVAFVTGHEAEDKADSALDWDALACWPGTLVFYMGLRNLPTISKSLIAHGRDPDTPAAAIHWGTTPRQQTVTGTLATLAQAARQAGLQAPAVILVGEVARLRDRLQWFERRPLLGRRIVVTRARAQASALVKRLEAFGAETIEAPAIRIEPPDDPAPLRAAARGAASFDWVIFTSVNGVEAFFGALADAGQDARALASARLATIGPATTERLARFGLRSDLEPRTFTGAGVAEALIAGGDLAGTRVLLPRADIAPKDLPEALAAHGAEVTDIVAYRTVSDTTSCDAVAEALEADEIDWLTFTSSSTVTNVVATVGADRIGASHARIASIGPATSATLRKAGLEPTVEADPHTIAGLVEAILTGETA